MSNPERMRILNLLHSGSITPEEAGQLLDALESGKETPPAEEPVALKDTRGRKPKKLRIQVDNTEKENGRAKVNVSIPVSLIRSLGPIALSSIPKDARRQMEERGIDLRSILSQVEELIDGGSEEDFVNIDTGGGGDEGSARVRVYVE